MSRARRAASLAVAALCGGACTIENDVVPEIVFGLDDASYWRDESTYEGVGDGRLLVTNNLDDTVTILDFAGVAAGRLDVLATVPVGLVPIEREGPHHVAADRAGEFYYVGISNYVPASGSGPHGVHGAGTADGHALKLRASDNVMVGKVRVERSPGDIRLTPDGTMLLQSHFDILKVQDAFNGGDPEDVDAALVIIDPVTMTKTSTITACPGMHGVAVSPDSTTAYVSCVSDEIAIIDLVARELVMRVPVLDDPGTVQAPVCYPYATTVSPEGDSVWVSCFESGDVLRYDVAAEAMDATGVVTLNGPAGFGTFTADGATLIVPHQGDNSVGIAFIDAATAMIIQDKLLFPDKCINPHAAKLVLDDAKVLIVCEGDHAGPGTLVLMDAATREVETSVELGRYPDDVAVLVTP